MKKFETPNLTVLEVELTDVITTSPPNCDLETDEDRS